MEVRTEEKKRAANLPSTADHWPKKRRHGSTSLFVAVDYIFLFIFFCFLCYFLLKIWPLRYSATLASSP